ncbi:MAG: hypothetical protein QOF52_3294 [Propionibacteriaceae bacterium]|nr:hypothetical protein [Propionibacteriaceae bacterium]
MTIRTDYPAAQQPNSDAPPRTSRRSADGWSIRAASTTAGVGLLLMSALAGFGKFVALDGLVTEGNATQTAQNIQASEGLFRLGIASLILVIALDVVIACALYRVFSPVNKGLSILAAAMRLVYAGVFMVAIGQLPGVLRLLTDDGNRAVFGVDQVNAQAALGIAAFTDIWYVSQFLFGLHLLIEGYLAYRSGFVPRVLGALLAIAGLGYATDSLGAVLSQGSWAPISSFTFLGEFLLALWLLIRARSVAVRASRFHGESGLLR